MKPNTLPSRKSVKAAAQSQASGDPTQTKRGNSRKKDSTARGDVARAKPALRIPPVLLEGDEPGAPPVSSPGQTYALGLTAPTGHLGPEEGNLPTAYGTQKLLLTAQDAHWLYAHWDLTDEQQRRCNAQSAHHHLVVRLQAETMTPEPVTEVHVHPESRHWFIHVPRAGTAYVAELGYYQSNRQWAVIATSAAAITPPDTVSADKTAQFGTMSAEGLSPPLAASARSGTQERQLPAAVRQFTLGEPTEAIQAREFRPETLQSVHALQRPELVRGAVKQEIPVIAEGQIGLPAQFIAAMGISSPAGEEMEIVSSQFGQEQPRERGFWFNVNAELILYGATEPDANVTLDGLPLKLRPDGTFSLRLALPDGDYTLAVAAVSAEGDWGQAGLNFSRRTDYQGEAGPKPQDPALQRLTTLE